MRIYVAGPMSGYPEHNFPAFREATTVLRAMGHEVISPAEMDEEDGFDAATAADTVPGSRDWADLLARDLKIVVDVDAVVVLPGWERSRGAQLEVHVARELGLLVYKIVAGLPGLGIPTDLQEVPKAPTENILEEAGRLVGNDRSQQYGHPAEDFERTAGAWSALFGWDVQPAQVALAMIVVKISRLQQTPDKRDSITDIAGYARTYEMVKEREKLTSEPPA